MRRAWEAHIYAAADREMLANYRDAKKVMAIHRRADRDAAHLAFAINLVNIKG